MDDNDRVASLGFPSVYNADNPAELPDRHCLTELRERDAKAGGLLIQIEGGI